MMYLSDHPQFPSDHSLSLLPKPVFQPVCGGNENKLKMIQAERVKSKHEIRELLKAEIFLEMTDDKICFIF